MSPSTAKGQLIQIGARANYGDLDKKWTPDLNGYYSNRWQTGAGEFGIMADLAYSQVKTRSQGIQYGRTAIVMHGAPDWPAETFFPASINFLNNEYDRKRYGISRPASGRATAARCSLRRNICARSTRMPGASAPSAISASGPIFTASTCARASGMVSLNNRIPVPAPGSPPFTFDSNGNFQTGVTNRENSFAGWWGNPGGANTGFGVNDQGQPMFDTCYNWATPAPGCQFGADGTAPYAPEVGTGSRINQNRNLTQDAALNVKWDPTNDLHFNFDGQYVESQVDNYDISIEMHSFANVGLDATGDLPRITLDPPTNINQSEGGLENPNNWYLRSVMDHLENSKGHELALRGDGEYDFHTDWLNSLKFGARYSDRKQKVQWSTYNWQNIANTWTDCGNTHPYWNIDSPPGGTCNATGETFKGYPAGFFEMDNFGTDFFGGHLGSFPFVPFDFLDQHKADLFSQELTGVGSFIPICQRNGQLGATPVELPNSCFTPDEVANVDESTGAAYAMLKFGGPDAYLGKMKISGNIGLRYVGTKDDSSGFVRYATIPGLNSTLCPRVAAVAGGTRRHGAHSRRSGLRGATQWRRLLCSVLLPRSAGPGLR